MNLPKLVRHQEHHHNPMDFISPKCKNDNHHHHGLITMVINIKVQDAAGDRVLI